MRAFCLLICTLAMVVPSNSDAATPDVAAAINDAMQDREYSQAIVEIEKAVAEIEKAIGADGTHAHYLTYLKGRALHYQEKYPEAVKVFEGFEQQFPKSLWLRRVRFAAAASHARMKGFEQAEQIYRSEAEYLLSVDRKDEIAGVYIAFAEQYFRRKNSTRN